MGQTIGLDQAIAQRLRLADLHCSPHWKQIRWSYDSSCQKGKSVDVFWHHNPRVRGGSVRTRQILSSATFPTPTRAKTATKPQHRWLRSPPMDTASMMWRVTSGSGLRTDAVPTIIRPWQQPGKSQTNPTGPVDRFDPSEPDCETCAAWRVVSLHRQVSLPLNRARRR